MEDDLESYDDHKFSRFKHTWLKDEMRKENIYFTSPSYGIDANTTFDVSFYFSEDRVNKMLLAMYLYSQSWNKNYDFNKVFSDSIRDYLIYKILISLWYSIKDKVNINWPIFRSMLDWLWLRTRIFQLLKVSGSQMLSKIRVIIMWSCFILNKLESIFNYIHI